MSRLRFLLILFVFSAAILNANESAVDVHHGILTGIQGGMTNTLSDGGLSPDTGAFGLNFAYLAACKKTENAKNYSYFKAGASYEAEWGAGNPLQGLGVFADGGAVLFDCWRIGAGVAGEYLTKKDVALGILKGFVLVPYIETSIMWQAFAHSGFDFGFRIGAPVKLTAQAVEPYYKVNSMDMLDWRFSIGYFHFFDTQGAGK